MEFLIICCRCGTKQTLHSMDMKEKRNINIEINDGWEGESEVTITCNSCGNKIFDDNEIRKNVM